MTAKTKKVILLSSTSTWKLQFLLIGYLSCRPTVRFEQVKIDIQNYILLTELQIMVKTGHQISLLWDSTLSIKHIIDGEVVSRSRSGVFRLPRPPVDGTV